MLKDMRVNVVVWKFNLNVSKKEFFNTIWQRRIFSFYLHIIDFFASNSVMYAARFLLRFRWLRIIKVDNEFSTPQ